MLLTELSSFIDANRYKGRREAFGIKDTKNYLRWAYAGGGSGASLGESGSYYTPRIDGSAPYNGTAEANSGAGGSVGSSPAGASGIVIIRYPYWT